MLNEISCVEWTWDAFAAVGTWVGGVGAAVAAIVAIWLGRREANHRRDFAKYLLLRDVDRLSHIASSLRSMAKHMGNWYEPDDNLRPGIRSAYGRALEAVKDQVDGFEYLGRSDQQFYFRPEDNVLSQLNGYQGRLKRIGETASDVRCEVDEGAAAKYLKETSQGIDRLIVGVKL